MNGLTGGGAACQGAAGSIHEEAALMHAQLIHSHPLRPIPQLQRPHSLQ